MRVLMFGWEFPPHITGGLGTACFGMTKGLAKNNVEVLFVVPRAYGDEDQSNLRLLNASDVTIDIDHEENRIRFSSWSMSMVTSLALSRRRFDWSSSP